jgi:AAHS family 4-hydroxybenzoate transporter-like MFS transporter
MVIALCALDGFDVLAITYAAPGILQEWGLSRAELGMAFSAGFAGMALGSFFIAPIADLIGRRRMIFICLGILAGGMMASAFASTLGMLAFWRVITGLGIGAMICIINPLAAEYSNARRHDLAIGLMAVGYPIGGTVGGLVSAQLLTHYDWRAVFVFGSLLGLVMLPLAYRWILEPVAYLIDKPGPSALSQVNAFLLRCGRLPVRELPAPAKRIGKLPIQEIFSAENRWSTLHLTAIYALFIITVYFLLSWMPQLITDLGFSSASAVNFSVLRDFTGVLSGILLGWASHYLGLKRVAFTVFIGMGLAVMAFGRLPADIILLRLGSGFAGLCLYGGAVSLYAIVARTFPARIRATGSGFVIGVGRVAMVIAPLLGGYLLTAGMDRGTVTLIMSLGALAAGALLIAFPIRQVVGAEAPRS